MPVIALRQFGDIGKIAGDAGKSITGVAGQAAGGASQAVEQTKQVTESVGDVANVRQRSLEQLEDGKGVDNAACWSSQGSHCGYARSYCIHREGALVGPA